METKANIESKLLRQLESKVLFEWLIPLLITCLISLLAFFGSSWIKRIEKDNSSNTQQIKYINDKQIDQESKITNLQKGQSDFVQSLDKLNYRMDQQNTDTRDIMSRTVRIETKLDYLNDNSKQDRSNNNNNKL